MKDSIEDEVSILKKPLMEYRCGHCKKLLCKFKGSVQNGLILLEIVCKLCKHINVISFTKTNP